MFQRVALILPTLFLTPGLAFGEKGAPSNVPFSCQYRGAGQLLACNCADGRQGVQQCRATGGPPGPCMGCTQPTSPQIATCDLVGTYSLNLKWPAHACTWGLDKTSFVISRTNLGYRVNDVSPEGAPIGASVSVRIRPFGCEIELKQEIDPEGAIAGSKSVSSDKYVYKLVELRNGEVNGVAFYESYEFDDKPACKGTANVSGVHLVPQKSR